MGRTAGPVLVVADEWRVLEVVQLTLGEYGFSVKTAADGAKHSRGSAMSAQESWCWI
ncbi:MAG TPA: response regulator [Chloroflexota bacterium]